MGQMFNRWHRELPLMIFWQANAGSQQSDPDIGRSGVPATTMRTGLHTAVERDRISSQTSM
jgi:hypothetical protein